MEHVSGAHLENPFVDFHRSTVVRRCLTFRISALGFGIGLGVQGLGFRAFCLELTVLGAL